MEIDEIEQQHKCFSPEDRPSSGLNNVSSNLVISLEEATSSHSMSKSPRVKGLRKRREIDPLTGLVTSTKKMRIGELQQTDEGNGSTPDDSGNMLFFDSGDDSDVDGYEYESDSNDENYYRNEYPDEEFENLENDSTSEEEFFGKY
jgi:hypothetical protein